MSAALRGYLARMGFQQAPTVTEPGEFAVRGGIIDIFPPGARGAGAARPLRRRARERPALRRRDPAHHRDGQARRARAGLRGDPRRRRRSSASAPATARPSAPPATTTRSTRRSAPAASTRATSTGCRSSTSGWRPCSTTCPARRCCSTTRSTPSRAARWAALADQYDARAAALAREVEARHRLQAGAAGRLYLDDAAWDAALAGRPRPPARRPAAAARPRRDRRRRAHRPRLRARAPAGGASASSARSPPMSRARRRKGDVVVASYSAGARERLAGLLADSGVDRRPRDRARPPTCRRRRRAASASRSGRWSTASRRRA